MQVFRYYKGDIQYYCEFREHTQTVQTEDVKTSRDVMCSLEQSVKSSCRIDSSDVHWPTQHLHTLILTVLKT